MRKTSYQPIYTALESFPRVVVDFIEHLDSSNVNTNVDVFTKQAKYTRERVEKSIFINIFILQEF